MCTYVCYLSQYLYYSLVLALILAAHIYHTHLNVTTPLLFPIGLSCALSLVLLSHTASRYTKNNTKGYK
ncbi:MAG: hypothetical protein JOS17DRAFT_741994 [Linnemannia elongata]|nr:MAG: hypothetical protein JOS17DRAFT_741994 [Linnemannia elongata]